MRLIRTILILTGAGVLMPMPPEDIAPQTAAGETETVSTLEMLSSASSAVSDVAGFCDRQPVFCETAAYVAGRFEAKAKYSARLIYEWASEASGDPAVPAGPPEPEIADLLETGSTPLVIAETAGQSTLRLDDLIPEWRGPSAPKKKG